MVAIMAFFKPKVSWVFWDTRGCGQHNNLYIAKWRSYFSALAPPASAHRRQGCPWYSWEGTTGTCVYWVSWRGTSHLEWEQIMDMRLFSNNLHSRVNEKSKEHIRVSQVGGQELCLGMQRHPHSEESVVASFRLCQITAVTYEWWQ